MLPIIPALAMVIAKVLEEKDSKNTLPITADRFAARYNEFSRTLLQKCKNKNENLILSPFSLLMLLAVAADATSGLTKKEIANALYNENCYEETKKLLCELQKVILSDTFMSSNAVCVDNSLEECINSNFIKALKAGLGGEVFASRDIQAEVNKWAAEKTKGLIEEINIPMKPNEELVACLLNAVAFKADWENKVEDTEIGKEEFENADLTTVAVDMMHSVEKSYIEDDYFVGFVKPYKKEFSFMALLPKEKDHTFFENAISKLDMIKLFANKTSDKVIVTMPEFESESNSDLRAVCNTMGIKTIFTEEADFSPMIDASLKAGGIQQKALIKVNREGTEAAAVTIMPEVFTIGIRLEPEPKVVKLDRPFIYAIMQNETAMPVFIGILNKMK